MKNLQEVSGFFFFSLGFAYFLAALFVYNHHLLPKSQIVFNILDMPFALAALLFGSASLVVSLKENGIHSRLAEVIIFLLGMAIFGGVVFINFYYPDII